MGKDQRDSGLGRRTGILRYLPRKGEIRFKIGRPIKAYSPDERQSKILAQGTVQQPSLMPLYGFGICDFFLVGFLFLIAFI